MPKGLFTTKSRQELQEQQGRALASLSEVLRSEELLSEHKRQTLVGRIQGYLECNALDFPEGRLMALEIAALAVQELPDTHHRFYTQKGGLLDYMLHRTDIALELFKAALDADSQAESYSKLQSHWQYALLTASLCQGLGKLYTDMFIQCFDAKGHALHMHHALVDIGFQGASYYDYHFQVEANVFLRNRATVLIARQIVGEAGLRRLTEHPDIFAVWLRLLDEDYAGAGVLGAILRRAHILALRLEWCQHLSQYDYDPYAKPHRGASFMEFGPTDLAHWEEYSALRFIEWARDGLAAGRLMINQSPLLAVPGGLLMCADMFKYFVREHPEFKNWRAVQNAFLAMGWGQQEASDNITRVDVPGHGMQEGVVLREASVILPDAVMVCGEKNYTLSAVHYLENADGIAKGSPASALTTTTFGREALIAVALEGIMPSLSSRASHHG